MTDNENICNCSERPEVDLHSDTAPLVVLSDCDCDCRCDEVELYTDHQPDIVLFEETIEEYSDDIVSIKETVENTQVTLLAKTGEIISKEEQIKSGISDIQDQLRRGIADVRSDISDSETEIKDSISDVKNTVLSGDSAIREDLATKTADIKSDVSGAVATVNAGVSAIRRDIADLQFDISLSECTEEEIYAMFPEIEQEEETGRRNNNRIKSISL